MKIIKSSIEVYWPNINILEHIEICGRTAYKTEPKDAEAFVRMIMKRGHLSVLEHVAISVRIICDRGVSHELVRHRIASYTQESTRYCNYSDDRFGGQLIFIMPSWTTENSQIYLKWEAYVEQAEENYFDMLSIGNPQEARSVLPNSLKTEIVMTANLREWLHFLNLRTAKDAHPDMQVVAKMILAEFKNHIPVIYDAL